MQKTVHRGIIFDEEKVHNLDDGSRDGMGSDRLRRKRRMAGNGGDRDTAGTGNCADGEYAVLRMGRICEGTVGFI